MAQNMANGKQLNYNRLEAGGLFGRLKSAKEPGGKPEATVNRKHSAKAEGLNPVVETITCIVCPMGCRMGVETGGSEIRVTGQGCRRGEDYARSEVTAPKRMITGVVRLKNRREMLPVKSAVPIPKDKLWAAMDEIRSIEAEAPVQIGEVLRENLAGTGVKLVATKNAR